MYFRQNLILVFYLLKLQDALAWELLLYHTFSNRLELIIISECIWKLGFKKKKF